MQPHHDGAACAAVDVPGLSLSAQIHVLAGAESSDHCRQHRWSLQQRNVQGEVLASLSIFTKTCHGVRITVDRKINLVLRGLMRHPPPQPCKLNYQVLEYFGNLKSRRLSCEREGYVCYRNLKRYWNVPLDEKPDIESKIIGVNLSLWTWLAVAPLPTTEALIFCRVQRNLCKVFINFFEEICSAFTSNKLQLNPKARHISNKATPGSERGLKLLSI